MMRHSVVFCLAVSFALFGFGLSLQCYSCHHGSTGDCETKHECSQDEDSCLKLTSDETTYTRCMRYTDCDIMALGVRYPHVSKFTFSCCQSDLCNGKKKKSFFQKLLDMLS